MKTVVLQEKYKGFVAKDAKTVFGVKSVMEFPKIEKVVINIGIGKIHKETQQIQEIIETLTEITGQRPVQALSKKAIAGFKVRQGAPVGLVVTLRRTHMWDFLNRLVHIALPRTRDFQGLDVKSIDKKGNLSIGIREHIIFPEMKPEQIQRIFGMQVNVVTTAHSKDQGEKLFRKLGFPIK